MLVTGCRTYGGYGNEEETQDQMQRAVQQFSSELDRARSDLTALSAAAQQNEALAPLEARYRDLIARHEVFLERHRRLAEHFQDGDTYRDLHRNYGAMISEQHLVSIWYNELHVSIRGVATESPSVQDVPPKARYVVNPSYYDRVQNRQGVTMQQALRGA